MLGSQDPQKGFQTGPEMKKGVLKLGELEILGSQDPQKGFQKGPEMEKGVLKSIIQ